MRVRDGTRASTAITSSATPSHHGAPRSPGSRPPSRSSKPRLGSGSRPESSSRLRAAPFTTAGSHHDESSTGTHASIAVGGPHTERSRISAGAMPKPTPTSAPPKTAAKNHATGVNAATRASSRPDRQAARQRRSGSGSAKPRAACPSHGSTAVTTTIPSRPSPQAPLTTGTSA